MLSMPLNCGMLLKPSMRMKCRRLPLLWRIFGALAPMLAAAAGMTGPSASPFIVDSWDNEKGLPDSEVISVIQGREGYLWLGTLHGLVRFDGNRFVSFDQHNTTGLSSDRIVYLFQDSRTDLWVGTESSGLDRIHNGVIQHFDTANVPGGGKVIYAEEDAKGDVWFYTAAETFFRWSDGKMNFYPGIVAPQLRLRAMNLLLPSRRGGFWQLFNGMVQKREGGRLIQDWGAAPWGSTPISAVCEDQEGNLIVGTLGAGIFWYTPDGTARHIGVQEGLSSPYILSLCLDGEGDLWAGTDGGGLDRIKRSIFQALPGPPRAALSLAADAHGGLWMAFNAAGISHWNGAQLENFAIGRASNAWTVLVTRQQQVWAGTRDEGLFQRVENHFVPVSEAAALGPKIFALYEDHAGNLWVGTPRGLAEYTGGEWRQFTRRDGLSGDAVRAIAEDPDGGLWVGTENHGLDYFKGGKFISYRAGLNGPPGDDISCLYVDAGGDLWVGTAGHGLGLFRNGKWKSFSTDNGLASDSISYLTEDRAGCLWIGSNAGLMRIPKQTLLDFAAGPTNVIFCRTYGKADGLPTRECSAGAQPATACTGDGRLWFPTTKGVAWVNPADIQTNAQPPRLLIESALVDGRHLNARPLDPTWNPTVTIPPGGGQLEIHYTALNFSAPESLRFKYRLETAGRVPPWTDAGGERVARFSNLAPGQYRFHVIACNEDGVWNQTGSTLHIVVLPEFWQTLWFRTAATIFILGLVAALARYISTQKLQRQLQRLRQREALERERARIARDLHDQLGANLTQVALLGEMAEADKDSPKDVEAHARQIAQTARETTRALDEIVWAVNPANDTLEGLVTYACQHAQEYLALAGLRCRADVPAQLPAVPLPPDVRHNVFLAFKEAVHNVVKHARAAEARIRLRQEPGRFILEIEDDGCGVSGLDEKTNRSGLRNMKKRMTDIGGEFAIAPGANGGTVVRLVVPISSPLDQQ